MKISIVLGLCFGDEGKGLLTSSLALSNKDLVVRFNGGHQAGHTVEKNGYRHIFSSFGSGALNRADTYISEYCTVHPPSLNQERISLQRFGKVYPNLFCHPLAMITTPFDIAFNRQRETTVNHSTVGVGFGATIERNLTPYKLYIQDLTLPDSALRYKIESIAKYYGHPNPENIINSFMLELRCTHYAIKTLEEIKNRYEHIVFEGAQGILLDMDHGFFPHVTRSNTTCKNAMQIIKDTKLPYNIDIYYCMRSYLTRHGNGYMPIEGGVPEFTDPTNKDGGLQGKFRFGRHHSQLLNYALDCDSIYSKSVSKNIVVTWTDKTQNGVYVGDAIITPATLVEDLNVDKVFTLGLDSNLVDVSDGNRAVITFLEDLGTMYTGVCNSDRYDNEDNDDVDEDYDEDNDDIEFLPPQWSYYPTTTTSYTGSIVTPETPNPDTPPQ